MKNLILIIIIIISTTACSAQKPIAKINNDQIKISSLTYKIQKEGNKYIVVRNSNNKLTNLKPVAPNLPKGISIVQNMKLDEKLLIKICSSIIPLSTLEKMPMGYGDWLSINFKVAPTGDPIEMEFVIRNTSLITAEEIQKIEDTIKKSSFKVVFKDGIEQFFGGVNYFNIDVPIRYRDMLKVKQNN
ncbi:hypothetical protein EZ456_08760 [Pedobacter psychrodurus]|uniref:Uncharacterized protein n=1 Tax=Pedobacter psychrodurus TaxID=2530456 RepID=A0A4R0PWV9_9SPHI|nr:hypothetical protein [Pedobacter psychrodurus]TCD27283.1 hypothetical protein EZ456_08760 [Pedobacter psychrodurus]